MKNSLKLDKTVDGMLSKDYKERFIAEYKQLKIRATNLENFIKAVINDEADCEPDCPIRLLNKQLKVMKKYKTILEKRADLELIKL